METSHRWHGGDTITTELGQLIAVGAVDVDEAVHVSDAEALDGGLGGCLPLGAETDELT